MIDAQDAIPTFEFAAIMAALYVPLIAWMLWALWTSGFRYAPARTPSPLQSTTCPSSCHRWARVSCRKWAKVRFIRTFGDTPLERWFDRRVKASGDISATAHDEQNACAGCDRSGA